MIRRLNRLQPWALFCLRVVLGVAMLVHGFDKLVPSTGLHRNDLRGGLDHFSAYVVHLGLPHWLGYVSVLTEFVGGIFLVFGFLTRLTAFLVTGDLLVALLRVDALQGYSASEYPLALLTMAALLIVAGSGAASLDRRIGLS